MTFSGNRQPSRIKSGTSFFRIMLVWWRVIFSENRQPLFRIML